VVGNLAAWFALHVVFRRHDALRLGFATIDVPVPASLDPAALALAVLAAICLFQGRLGVLRTLGITSAAGLVLRFAVRVS
jgi:chromate transporter